MRQPETKSKEGEHLDFAMQRKMMNGVFFGKSDSVF